MLVGTLGKIISGGRSFLPGEHTAALAEQKSAWKYAHAPRLQAQHPEGFRCWAIPARNNARVIADWRGAVEKHVPYPRARRIIIGPDRAAIGNAGIVRGHPIARRQVGAASKM